VQGLGLRAGEEELVDETAAGVEAETAVRGETYLSVVALLLCGRQGKTCLLAPVTRTVNCCWSATLPRGLEGASIVCVCVERNWDRVSLIACYEVCFWDPWI